MALKAEHMTGFAMGIGAAAVGYVMYRKNQAKVDRFLREQGIDIPSPAMVDVESLSLEQLVAEKERLEDFIAEREMTRADAEATEPQKPAAKPTRKRTRRKKAVKADSERVETKEPKRKRTSRKKAVKAK